MQSLTIVNLVLLFYSSTVSGKLLKGQNLRLTAYNNYPYDSLVRQPDGNITFTGISDDIIQWLAIKLNFTFSFVPVFQEESNLLNTSDLDLALRKVIENKADGTATHYIADPERAAKLDYTFFVTTELFTLIVPQPQPVNRLFAFIRPFQPIVWLFTGLITLLFIGMMCWFSWIYNHKFDLNSQSTNHKRNGLEEFTDNIGYYSIYVANILTKHGMYLHYAKHSFRILAAGWLLATLVLVNSYSSIVVSSLTVPLKNPPINSFEDLAASKDVFLILRKDLVITKQILSATSGAFKVLGDTTRAHPDRLFNDYLSVFKQLENGHYAFVFILSFNRAFVWRQYKKYGKCNFLVTDPLPLSTGYFRMLMQKGSPYVPALDFGLIRLRETGLIDYWVSKQTPKTEECTVSFQKKSRAVGRQTKIKLEDLTGAFFILGAGLGAAILIFLIELIIYRIRNRIRKPTKMKSNSAVVGKVNQLNDSLDDSPDSCTSKSNLPM